MLKKCSQKWIFRKLFQNDCQTDRHFRFHWKCEPNFYFNCLFRITQMHNIIIVPISKVLIVNNFPQRTA